jgi:ABC-type cobalamin/Fe3+-siderophores transport system ATPase subunit
MNNLPVVSSLRIKKLFGEHDLSIDFQKLTVIVGKNGLGKTTLLKIINGLISGVSQVNYQDICESVELEFSDGNVICYGTVTNSFVEAIAKSSIDDLISEHKEMTLSIEKLINGMANIPDEQKKEIVKELYREFVHQDNFNDKAYKYFSTKMNEDRNKILVNHIHLNELKKNIIVRYISTVNISANAGNKIDIGNSIEKNLLDIAIHEELRLLLKKGNSMAVDVFTTQLNTFLQESGKTAKLDHNDWFFITSSGKELNLSQLSSGERQLVYILATAANTCGKPTLFLMDEPEVSLHLSWQEKIIDAIMNINPLMQIIAVTHSPGIIMNGHMDAYIEMKDIMQENRNV